MLSLLKCYVPRGPMAADLMCQGVLLLSGRTGHAKHMSVTVARLWEYVCTVHACCHTLWKSMHVAP